MLLFVQALCVAPFGRQKNGVVELTGSALLYDSMGYALFVQRNSDHFMIQLRESIRKQSMEITNTQYEVYMTEFFMFRATSTDSCRCMTACIIFVTNCGLYMGGFGPCRAPLTLRLLVIIKRV